MAKFIEVTSKEWGDKRLINTGYIISLVEDEENTAFLVTYRDRKGSKGFMSRRVLTNCGKNSWRSRAEKKMMIKEVYIPACAEHEGLYGIHVNLRWVCPICGKPRGEIQRVLSYDGSRYLECDGWQNPCGHVDKYSNLRVEAFRNGLNEQGEKTQ